MKKFYLLFALLLGALTANAEYVENDARIYFDATGWDTKCLQFCIGHNSYTSTFVMSKITNTNLYYHKKNGKWDNATYMAFIGTSSKWGDGDWGPSNLTNADIYTGQKNSWSCNNEFYLFTKGNANKGAQLDVSWIGKETSSWGNLNHNQNVTVLGGGSVTMSSYKLNGENTTTASSGTTSVSAAYTATVTCKATANDGYEFVGWYDGSTLLSSEATYTYAAPNAEKTITAQFKAVYPTELSVVMGETTVELEATDYEGVFTGSFDTYENTSLVLVSGDLTYGAQSENTALEAGGEYLIINGTTPWTVTPGMLYTITVDLTKGLLSVSDIVTGIDEVGVDAGEAVYYNLQGVKVANPENGIFIKKQAGKTTKVIL